MATDSTAIIKRRCTVCGEVKWSTEYHKKSGSTCKVCHRKRCREYRKNHRRHLNKLSKVFHDKPENKKRARMQVLARNYGITVDKYNDMFIEQAGKCAICGRHQSEMDRALAVDHCHKTKIIRGLLCGDCNRAMGSLREDIQILKNAIKYLENSNGCDINRDS